MRIPGILFVALVGCGVDAPESRQATQNAAMSPLEKTAVCDTSTAPVPATCEDAGFAPDSPDQSFRHWKNKAIAAGPVRHRGVDMIVAPDQPQHLIAKIAYGLLDIDLQDEVVEIWAQTSCSEWRKLGSTLTTDGHAPAFEGIEDDGGRVFFTLPQSLPLGDYRIRLLVKGDHSTADFWLRVWPTGTRIVVSDIDGTMTTEENDGLWSVFNPEGAEAQLAAADMMQAYYAKGYRVLFVTARPEFLTNGTRRWLQEQGFPPNSLHTSQSNFGESGPPAQAYKTAYVANLLERGMIVSTGYGNKETDLDAYNANQLPKVVLISGEYAGDLKGATMVDDYVSEAQRVSCISPL